MAVWHKHRKLLLDIVLIPLNLLVMRDNSRPQLFWFARFTWDPWLGVNLTREQNISLHSSLEIYSFFSIVGESRELRWEVRDEIYCGNIWMAADKRSYTYRWLSQFIISTVLIAHTDWPHSLTLELLSDDSISKVTISVMILHSHDNTITL